MSLTRPRISVVTPTNRKRLDERLTAYFACLSRQRVQPDEVVLVSEDACDPSPAIQTARDIVGRQLPSAVQVVISESPSLVYKRNLGIHFARGDVVLMMDDDDLYAEHYIDTTVQALARLRTPYLILALNALAYRPGDHTYKRLAYASGPTVAFHKAFFDALGIRYAPGRRTANSQDVHESITLLDAVQYLGLPYPYARDVGRGFLYVRYGDGFNHDINLGDDGWTPDRHNRLLTQVVGPRLAEWLTGASCWNGCGSAAAVTAGDSPRASSVSSAPSVPPPHPPGASKRLQHRRTDDAR